MPKRKPTRKHSVKANLHVVELTRAGSSLDLEVYADQEKIGTMIIGQGSLSWKGGKRQNHETDSLEPLRGHDGRACLRLISCEVVANQRAKCEEVRAKGMR